MRFAGRVAVVTGAGGAIGGAIPERLASEGASMALTDLDADALRTRADQLQPRLSSDAVLVAGDLSDTETAASLAAACRNRFGGIDVLVNNAGGGIIRPTLEHTEETLQATLARNLWTALRTTFAVLPVMRDAGYGRIV